MAELTTLGEKLAEVLGFTPGRTGCNSMFQKKQEDGGEQVPEARSALLAARAARSRGRG
jgi:hypothetical protein